jgi:hypothetical protein
MVTNYTGNRNALIPIRMIFPGDLREKPLPFADTVTLPQELNKGEYITVLPSTILDTNYKILRMEVSFRMFTEEKDKSKFPPLVFNIINREGEHVIWRQLNPSRDAAIIASEGSWYTIAYRADMNISFVKNHADKQLKLYLWNQQSILVQYDSLNVTINGFY